MDIWEWVGETTESLRDAGQERLAELIDALPTACCNGEHDRVESMVPEALSLAKIAKNPWLEVFIRHWLMQSRVLHRHDVSRDTLKQAVALVELASRPETKDCPQSVCAVQDLCAAYGLVDGVGYAEQRLAVSDEALARIEPDRNCFDCVSSERADALIDSGRYQDALAFCEAQLARRPAHRTGLDNHRVRCLTALGRHTEAARVTEHPNLENAGKDGELTNALLRCLVAARLGKLEQASRDLPPPRELSAQHYLDWLRCVRELGTGEGSPNSWRLERVVSTMHDTLTRYESHFILAKIHKIAAELALQRGNRSSTMRHLTALEDAATRLVSRDWVGSKLNPLRAAVEGLPPAPSYATVEQLLESMGRDPERDLDLLAPSPFGADVRLVRRKASALEALGWGGDAVQVLEAAWLAQQDDVDLTLDLLETLLNKHEHARLAELSRKVGGAAQAGAQWALARSLYAQRKTAEAQACCTELVAQNPQHDEARCMLATLLRDAGELSAALEHLNALVARNEPGNYDWDRMLVGTLAGAWDAVRASALRMELPVEPDEQGPIDERWGACRLRLRLVDGQERAYFAWRTGPVTACVDEVVAPGEEQHHADLVAFDAAPVNQAELTAFDETEQASEHRPLCEYMAYRVLAPGHFRAFEIDGFLPTAEGLGALTQGLAELGVAVERRSGEGYRLSDGDQQKPALYAFLGLPQKCTELQAHQALAQLAEQHSLRLVWPKLADAAGDSAAAAGQRQLADAWGIE